MFKYFHIIHFLMTHNLSQLKEHWRRDIIKRRKFKWSRLLKTITRSTDLNPRYWFWWRLAREMHLHGSKKQKSISNLINLGLIKNYNLEITLNVDIGFNPFISHFCGIVINGNAEIGNNFICRQNVTIGWKSHPLKVIIGDNVKIGASSVILGGEIKIGDNTEIGAMSFITRDIPNNCIVYTEKKNKIIEKTIY